MISLFLLFFLALSPADQQDNNWGQGPMIQHWSLDKELGFRILLSEELVDSWEYPSAMFDWENFLLRVEMRREELMDAPLMYHRFRFPPAEVIQEIMDFNWECLLKMELRREGEAFSNRRLWWDEVIQDTEKRRDIYDLLRDIQSEYMTTSYRRRALKTLKERLGEEAFFRGELPSPVPPYYFAILRD